MFQRKAYQQLLHWKETSKGKTAALIEGARRVGKSTLATTFAKEQYADYLLIDFSLEKKDVQQLFEDNLGNLDTFFQNLFLLKGKALTPNNSLIIFDEVQLCPAARQAIKHLVADGRYDYLETGSLISIKKNVESILIPSEEYRIKMYPLDFEEFLWATGDTVTTPAIQTAFNERNALPSAVHRKIMNLFRTYIAVGGMPQAVASYVTGEAFETIDFIKANILSLYKEDFNKYGANGGLASRIFTSIPEQLTHHNSHFTFSVVEKGSRYLTIAKTLEFLNESMTVLESLNISDPDPLTDLHIDSKTFKLFIADTGLLITQAMKSTLSTKDDLYKALIFNHASANLGMVMENAVAQALAANGHPLRFHTFSYTPSNSTREKHYELDFVIVKDGAICPVEVKSSGYRAHKSLNYFYEKYQVKSKERFVLYPKNLQQDGLITYLPLYMAMCL